MVESKLSTPARLAQRIAQGRQRQLLPTIPSRPQAGPIELSVAQARFWLLNQLDPSDPVHNRPLALLLRGQLNLDALQQTLNTILGRHEVLRTVFPQSDGEPCPAILPSVELPLSLVDLGAVPLEQRKTAIISVAREESQKPFDLASGPLGRATLVRLAEAEHLLVWVMHHAVCDGWSARVLLKELAALYAASVTGQPLSLADLPIQYADYAHWQRKQLRQGMWDTQRVYWQRKLANAPASLNLPTDRPRPAVQSSRGAVRRLSLPSSLVNTLTALGRQESVTLFMVLLAAFKVLLARYTGQEDIVVGAPSAGRMLPELEPLVGFFANTLALRTDLAGNPTFRELLARVRQTALAAYDHQDLPFEEVIDALRLPRNLSYAPLCQVLFVMESFGTTSVTTAGLDIEEFTFDSGTTTYDLILEITPASSGLTAAFTYSTDLFADATIERLSGHFETLLHGIVADPGARVGGLPLLTEAERQQLLVEWNDTHTAYPRDVTIHQLFEAQVQRTPDAVAVLFEGEQITYQALNERANQLAHYLGRMGVGPETLVGLCLERSVEMIVGLLAILKAGAAYVPLDPAYPSERLAFLLADTQIAILLTQAKMAGRFQRGVQILELDTQQAPWGAESVVNPAVVVTATNLAYVMYTSGSTGRPKGVDVTHRNVVRLVKETNYVCLNEQAILLQLAPISFDAATFEVWGALLNGARLVIMPPQTPSLDEVAEAIQRHQINTLWLSAGLFRLMVDEHLDALGSVRQLLAGGDVLSVTHMRKVLAAHANCHVSNGYGPTENTTFTCTYRADDAQAFDHSVPIGRPIANTQVYILDAALQPVPIGVVGELYAGGDGVARGYHNRPELTREKFIPNPFGEGRLYRTGDLVRYLRDRGAIEFLGRMDSQVKIRGFRIEPGEVEAMLAQYPAIQEAVVLAREHGARDKHLVAYVVPVTGATCDSGQVRDFLKAKLPDYMLPSALVLVADIPLTANGKIDRRALLEIDLAPSAPMAATATQQTSIEEQLSALWAELLDVSPVGANQNFFELGGHSLLAGQLVSRVRKAFGVKLPLRALFEAPTVREFSQALAAAQQDEAIQRHVQTANDELRAKLHRLGYIT